MLGTPQGNPLGVPLTTPLTPSLLTSYPEAGATGATLAPIQPSDRGVVDRNIQLAIFFQRRPPLSDLLVPSNCGSTLTAK